LVDDATFKRRIIECKVRSAVVKSRKKFFVGAGAMLSRKKTRHQSLFAIRCRFWLRRMFSEQDPKSAQFDPFGVVQFQGFYCRPPTRGETDDARPILAPTKMPFPLLPSWVEQGHNLPRLRVNAGHLNTFVPIASATCHAKVSLVVRPTFHQRDDVVNLQLVTQQVFVTLAIFAPMSRPL
jgi:hypothetical protein